VTIRIVAHYGPFEAAPRCDLGASGGAPGKAATVWGMACDRRAAVMIKDDKVRDATEAKKGTGGRASGIFYRCEEHAGVDLCGTEPMFTI
jgi:hypothetical protein